MRRREYFHSGRRRCGACDALLKPAEPANMIGNLAFGVPLGIAISAVMLYVMIAGAPTTAAKLKVAAVIVLILAVEQVVGMWAWPFITPFAVVTRRCWNCGWEEAQRFAPCRRCGAPQQPVTRARAARMISPSGSGGSPATSGSA